MNTDPTALVDKLRGRFIVFDGPDGAGKSTQRQQLADRLEALGASVVSCRDPGGTEIGDRIRSVLLDHDLRLMNVRCETLLFMASRAQLVADVIQPALNAKKTVLCDRFVTSTCAYQGAAGQDPRRVVELATFAIDDCWPDLTLIVDIDTDEGFQRIGRKPHHAGKNREQSAGTGDLFQDSRPDAMEARPIRFHRKVREMFLKIRDYYPTPVETIDGQGSVETVHQRVLEVLDRVTF